MKISGVKFNVNVDVGEFDLDLKDVLDIQRLQWEQRRELRKECHDVCETDRRFEELSKAGPSSETKTFVEAIVNKAISKIKEEIVEQIKTGGKRKPINPDERIED